MNQEQFDQLVRGVTEMKQHLRGERVAGVQQTEFPEDSARIKSVRESAKVSQIQFAKLIGVSLRTLQSWEQNRTRPTGPARALLQIVAIQPQALKALHV